MNYQLSDHIYACEYNGETIILDTIKDKYLLLGPENSTILSLVLNDLHAIQEVPNINKYVEDLLRKGILHQTKSRGNTHKFTKVTSTGAQEVAWRVKEKYIKRSSPTQFISAFLSVLNVNLTIRIFGLYRMICQVRKNGKKFIPRAWVEEDIWSTVNALNTACYFFPTRNKCLKWSLALAKLLLNKGIKCNVIIGIQNYPFIAHAWVELEDKTVVADDNQLPHNLGIILVEPFGEYK